MAILRVESVTFGVEDVAAASKFYEDWGLELIERGAQGADFALPSGQIVSVRSAHDRGLPVTAESGSTLRETIWGVDFPSTVDLIGDELSRDRDVTRDTASVIHTYDPNGFAIGFRPVRRRPSAPPVEPIARLNHPFDMPSRAQPLRIGHIVYFTRAANERTLAEFYMQRLDFRLSDHSLNLGYFLRADGARDHHTLGVFGFLDRDAFSHMAFEVASFDEVMAGGVHMEKQGWQAATKPGRHVVGSNVFWNFKNPSGGQAEYFCDMDVMDDSWTPRVFEKHPGLAYWSLG